jgi:ATP-dependent DNA helicase PIF1
MAAVVQWARAHGKHISIFVAKHETESGKRLRVEELRDVLRHGDDSQLPTAGLFFYAQGMPVVVTRNQFVGLKVVNGAPFKAVDIFPNLASGTIALASDATLHLGPPMAVLLESDDSAGVAIPGLPNGTILIKSKTVAIPNAMRGKEARSRGKAGFRWVTHRTGPLCTPAFAMTDQKSQGKQFSDALLNLKGVHSSGTATRPSFMSLYVQLSRAENWDGLHLFRTPARGDFIEPKNVLDKDMRDAILKLERRGEETRRRFEQDHRNEPWFREWDAMAESAQATEAADEDDASLWCEAEVSDTGQ